MFGYIRIYKPELKVKEFEIYNAVYCGLCRYLGKNYGALSKLFLNYDATLIALLSSSLTEGCDGYERRRCRANPLKKCTYCKNDAGYMRLAAASLMVLSDLKVKDNIADGGFFVALCCRAVGAYTGRKAKKAYREFPALKDIAVRYQSEQKSAENGAASVDAAAEPTAKALSQIFGLIGGEEKYRFVLEKMGYCIGKWVYLCDAAEDLEKDMKKGRFNPLSAEAGDEDPLAFAKRRLTPVMNNCRTELLKYSQLLNYEKYREITDNIFGLGLKYQQDKIFEKEPKIQ